MLLEVRDIWKSYGGHQVLKGVSYAFAEGKIYGIIGPNGAGKSTLLRVLTGMEKPERGKVFWRSKEQEDTVSEITCMWQRPYLFQTTVRENVLYGLKIRGWSRARQEERLASILDRFRLKNLSRLHAASLSGGETARVALARAVAPQPRVLVLDEPAANLDPANTLLLENALREICAKEGMTAIVVTHDMFQAKRLAAETLFLSEGVLEEHGSTEQVFSSPRSDKTRKFISGEL